MVYALMVFVLPRENTIFDSASVAATDVADADCPVNNGGGTGPTPPTDK